MSMCLVQHMVVTLLAINMEPMLSTLTMTGYLTAIFMLPNSCTANITSSTASDKAIYSAYELERETLFCNFDRQEAGTPSK